MPLLKNNEFVADHFIEVADDMGLPSAGNVLISSSRITEAAALNLGIGIRLNNTDKVEALVANFPQITLIVLPFPAFSDGRSYSIGRQLRLEGYRGELRAEGNILPDQLQLMLQVGFDSFLVTERFPLAAWQAASQQMSLAYQRGLYRNQETEVWSSRHQGFNAWEEQPHAG